MQPRHWRYAVGSRTKLTANRRTPSARLAWAINSTSTSGEICLDPKASKDSFYILWDSRWLLSEKITTVGIVCQIEMSKQISYLEFLRYKSGANGPDYGS